MLDRERRELYELNAKVKHAYELSPYGQEYAVIDFIDVLVAEAARRANVVLPEDFELGVKEFVYSLTRQDPVLFWMPELPDDLTIEASAYARTILTAKERFLSDPERIGDIWREKLIRILEGFFGYLPSLSRDGQFKISVMDACDVPEIVDRIMATMYDDDIMNTNLYEPIRGQFERNLAYASGMTMDEAQRRPGAIVRPAESKRPPSEIVSTYLYGTVFEQLFSLNLPFALPDTARFSHHWIVAPPGTGKSTTLQYLISRDLELVRQGQASVIVMESKRDLVKAVEGLRVFAPGGELEGKLVSIDIEDVEYPVALNLFDVGMEEIGTYSPRERETLFNSALSLYAYIFDALLGAEMTSRQSTLFNFTIQLLLQIPGATIDTLIDLMQKNGVRPYEQYLSNLDHDAQRFFALKFDGHEFDQTKSQVTDRLFGVKRIRTLARMFSAPRTKLDLYTEMGRGKVILINAPSSLLGQDGVEIVGRFFIAMILLAAEKRQLLPQHQRLPTYIYIDECQTIIRRDEKIPIILDQARAMAVALILAHQRLDQLAPSVLNALYGSTAIKFAAKVNEPAAPALARSMGTTAELLAKQPDYSFAAFIRGVTDAAVSLRIPFTDMNQMERMTAGELDTIRQDMRERYAIPFSDAQSNSFDQLGQEQQAPAPRSSPPGKRIRRDPDDVDTKASSDW